MFLFHKKSFHKIFYCNAQTICISFYIFFRYETVIVFATITTATTIIIFEQFIMQSQKLLIQLFLFCIAF